MRIAVAGENALIIYFDDAGFSAQASPAVAARVQAAKVAIATSLDSVLIDLIPSYASLTLIYDALKTDHFLISQTLNALLNDLDNAESGRGSLVTLPVYYSVESGPELELSLIHI